MYPIIVIRASNVYLMELQTSILKIIFDNGINVTINYCRILECLFNGIADKYPQNNI